MTQKETKQRVWTTNGYIVFKAHGKLTKGHVKALETELKRMTKGPRFYPIKHGKKWTCEEVLLQSGNRVRVSFETDAEPDDAVLDEISDDLFGADGSSGLIGQYVGLTYAPDSLEPALYGGYREDEVARPQPLSMSGGDIEWNVGKDKKATHKKENNMSINKAQVAILAQLVEQGFEEAADKLAHGLSDQAAKSAETEIVEKSPEELVAMLDADKVDEVIAYLMDEESPEEKTAEKKVHDALLLRGQIRDLENEIDKTIPEINLPSEEDIMDSPEKFLPKMKKALSLLKEAKKSLDAYLKFQF